jgi:hypothetical protein
MRRGFVLGAALRAVRTVARHERPLYRKTRPRTAADRPGQGLRTGSLSDRIRQL